MTLLNSRFAAIALFCVAALTSVFSPASSVLAQGSLTPPGAPAPLFKTLQQVEPRTPISGPLPLAISSAGSYYLTTNLTGVSGFNGITISASDVSLDLTGFALIGVAGSLDGIVVSGGRTNLAIRNGVVRSWGANGIQATNSVNGRFEALHVSDNTGSGLIAGTNSLVRSCLAQGNDGHGIVATRGSSIVECSAFTNGAVGIVLFPATISVPGGRVVECNSALNGSNGFLVARSMVLNCYAANNRGHGIEVNDECVVSGSLIKSNALDGIRLVARNRIIGNTISGPGNSGGTTNACIAARTGSANRIEDNHMMTHDTGLIVALASGSGIVRNSTQGTATNYLVTAGNLFGPIVTAATVGTNTNPHANYSY